MSKSLSFFYQIYGFKSDCGGFIRNVETLTFVPCRSLPIVTIRQRRIHLVHRLSCPRSTGMGCRFTCNLFVSLFIFALYIKLVI